MFKTRRDIQNQIIKILWDTWIKFPDLRLGQLIENVSASAKIDAYYIEDDIVACILKDMSKLEIRNK